MIVMFGCRWAEGTSVSPNNTGNHTGAIGIFVNSHFDSGNIEVHALLTSWPDPIFAEGW